MDQQPSSRRSLLKAAGVGGLSLAGAGVLGCSTSQSVRTSNTTIGSRRTLRVAHLSDIHMWFGRGAPEGLAQCLHHMQALRTKPQLILNTGDCIFDATGHDHENVKSQWEVWRRVWKNENALPVRHALGNHDMWGVDAKRSKTTGREPGYGAAWTMDELGLAKPYYSFDQNGWHFIVLNSIQLDPDGRGWHCRLDPEQLDWLTRDLAAVPAGVPTVVASHVPIFSSAAGLIHSKPHRTESDVIVNDKKSMHMDCVTLHELFRKQGNVKLCLSGHLHMLDRAEFDGITYISTLAVASHFWDGVIHGRFGYGYGIVDLHDDGNFDYTPMTYGWTTRPETEAEIDS